jgi:hypothetical protein
VRKKQRVCCCEFRKLFESTLPGGELKRNTIRAYTSRMAALAERQNIQGPPVDIYTPSWLGDPDTLIDDVAASQSVNSVRATLSACITYLRRVAALSSNTGASTTARVLERIYCNKLRRMDAGGRRSGVEPGKKLNDLIN